MVNIINELMIKNKGNGKGYSFKYKDKTYLAATMNDLVKKIYDLPGVYTRQWHKDIVNEITKLPEYAEERSEELFCDYLAKSLNAAMTEKRNMRDEYQKNSLPSAFNADIISCKFKPANDYNDKDKELLEIFVYCEDNGVIYTEIDGNYSLIGTPLDISNRKSNASYLAGSALKKHMDAKRCTDYQIWAELYHLADTATDKFFAYRRTIEEAISQGTPPSEIIIKYKGEDISMQEFLSLPLDKFSDDWDDALHTAICKIIVNELMPASLFNNDIIQLCFEAKNEMFHRYSVRPAHGKKANLNTIVSMMFEDPCIIDNIRHIKGVPHIISDGPNVFSEFKIQKDWQNKLPEQYESGKECKALKTFLEPFTDNERKVMMAWAYMALHPSTGESIGMLIQTGGGTFKTGYYAEMIRYLMSIMYNAPKDRVGFMMKKDAWVENTKLREPGNRGISKAGLVIIDEAGSRSIEQYKLWSGSTVDVGIDYEYSKIYQEGVQTKIFCPWLFTSNEDINLGDDKGVYDRRLIVIKRMDLSNFEKPYDMKDYHISIRKEAIHFYNFAKKSYEELVKKYGSITSAVNKIQEIHANLACIFEEEAKLNAYENLYNDMRSDNPFADHIEVPIPEFNSKVEELAAEMGVNPKGLTKYIFTTDKTTEPNVKGKCTVKGGRRVRIHILYPIDTAKLVQ